MLLFRDPHSEIESNFGLGLRQSESAISVFPFAALFHEFDTLKTFQDIPFGRKSAAAAKRTMTGHKLIHVKGEFPASPIPNRLGYRSPHEPPEFQAFRRGGSS